MYIRYRKEYMPFSKLEAYESRSTKSYYAQDHRIPHP